MIPYDPDARRETPLAQKLTGQIRRSGPLTVADYMAACLLDPEHGFYTGGRAIGRGGAFVTAPEISQVFGELIGLWAVVVWQRMGAPGAVTLVEVGPGRGTLMRDALRAATRVAAFAAAVEVILVEHSPAMTALQAARLAGCGVPIRHVGDMAALGRLSRPGILIANEVVDCLPVEQIVHLDGRVLRRTVALDAAAQLTFALDPAAPAAAAAVEGAAVEERRTLAPWLAGLAAPFAGQPFAALLLDYGHLRSGRGDTLQAIRAHVAEHPLTSPGEADLSAQVDFEDLVATARRIGLAVDGPVTQAEFLAALGIVERASRLMAANPAQAAGIEADVARLIAPVGMGTRFKAVGLRTANVAPLPGFPVAPISPPLPEDRP